VQSTVGSHGMLGLRLAPGRAASRAAIFRSACAAPFYPETACGIHLPLAIVCIKPGIALNSRTVLRAPSR
jgi:hypothetical protein